MYEWLIENGSTLLVSSVLLALVAGVVFSLWRQKKKGQSVGCGCNCSGCPSASRCGKKS